MIVGHGEVLVLEPGQTFCYQVSDPELGCGSLWSINTVQAKGDVYIRTRDGGTWIHSSFHHSGQWHYSLSKEAVSRNPGDEPHFAIRHEHANLASGWEHAHRVTVNRNELRHHQELAAECQVSLVRVPPGSDAVVVDVFLRAPNASGLLEFDSSDQLIAVMKRGDGGFVLILALPSELSAVPAIWRSQKIDGVKKELKEQGWDGKSTRIVVFGLEEVGFHHEIEIAIDGP